MNLDRAQLATWIARQLDERPRGTRSELAKHLGLKPDQITRMTNVGGSGEARDVSGLELLRMIDFFGAAPGESWPSDDHTPDQEHQDGPGVREIDIRAGMGGGGVESRAVVRNGIYHDAVKAEKWQFPRSFLAQEVRAPEERLIIAEAQGDSMSPTITSGERVLVDTGHRIPSPDGIYALRDRFGALVVKRLQVLRSGDPARVLIISDNQSHPQEDVGLDEIEIVGRVLMGFRRF